MDMGTWEHGDLETWVPKDMRTWVLRDMETWDMGTWGHGAWGQGFLFLTAQPTGSMASHPAWEMRSLRPSVSFLGPCSTLSLLSAFLDPAGVWGLEIL